MFARGSLFVLLVSLMGLGSVCTDRIAPVFAQSISADLSLSQALERAYQMSPEIKAASSREAQARSEVEISKSHYYPTVLAQAIDTTGFPASSGYLQLGGMVGSPYRSGLGAGVVLTQTLYDFGRTSARVETTKNQVERQVQDTRVTRFKVSLNVIRAYFMCSLDRSQAETWKILQSNADVVGQEVNHYVLTGQRTVVDRYLAETQIQEARTAVADYEARQVQSKVQLGILMGMDAKDTRAFNCPVLNDEMFFHMTPSSQTNPWVARSEAEVKVVESDLASAKSERLPTIVGIGSAAYLQDVRLVNKSDYALGLGVSLPLFDGFRIQEKINEASARVEEKNYELRAAQESLDQMISMQNEIIESREIRLKYLRTELELAKKAFELAKKRYFSFQGELVDVRAALTNLTRVLLDENETRSQYLQAKQSQEVLHGSK